MGWVVEQAGGRASTGAAAMLDQEVSPYTGRIHFVVHFLRAARGSARSQNVQRARNAPSEHLNVDLSLY